VLIPAARARWFPPLFVVAVGLLRWIAGARLGFRPFDDTFISFRYADNLASGLGFVYNPGEHVLGTTTPLWTMVLATMRLAHVPLETGSLVFSLGADAVTAILLCVLLTSLGYPAKVAAAAAITFLCSFDYLSLARSGMEVSLFVGLVVATLAALSARRQRLAGLLAGLCCLTRPEGAILAGVVVLHCWRYSNKAPKRGLSTVLIMIAVVGAWLWYAQSTFGSPVPQSVVAKAATRSDPSLAAFSWTNLALFFLKGQYGDDIFTRTYLQLTPIMTMLALIGAFCVTAGSRAGEPAGDRATLLLLFPVVFIGALALAGAFTFFPWYYGPIYPFLSILAIVGIWELVRRRGAPVAKWGVPLATIVLVAAQVGAAVLVKLPAARSYWVEGYMKVASVIPREPPVTVAAFEIGTVGWVASTATIVDLVGLVTPDAVGADALAYLQRRQPDYLVLRTDDAEGFLERSRREPWFANHYALVAANRDPYVPREFRTYRRVAPTQ